jgi:hypothetical protein
MSHRARARLACLSLVVVMRSIGLLRVHVVADINWFGTLF